MYKVSYKLHKSKKPFFDLNINGTYITCLYDTGATAAVWCSSKKLFEKVFPERILQDSKFSIGGFGGKSRILSDIFRVEGFKLWKRCINFYFSSASNKFSKLPCIKAL